MSVSKCVTHLKYSNGTKFVFCMKPLFLDINAAKNSSILLRNKSHSSRKSEGGFKIYKTIFLFVCLPAIAALSYWNYNQRKRQKLCYERPPFVKYPYLYIRSKRFPWGDGNKSLFHNKEVNPLPDGYED